MNEKTLICGRCGNKCQKQIYSDPTWFGKYIGQKIIEIICIDCWNKGERWENSFLKK